MYERPGMGNVYNEKTGIENVPKTLATAGVESCGECMRDKEWGMYAMGEQGCGMYRKLLAVAGVETQSWGRECMENYGE